MVNIKALRDRKAALLKEAADLQAKEVAGTITPEEIKRLDALLADDGDIVAANAAIARAERLMDEMRREPAAASLNADTPEETEDRKPARVEIVKEQKGFASLGEQLRAVAAAGMPGRQSSETWDRRLTKLYQPGGMEAAGTPSGANEGVPSEGGFLIQQDLAAPIAENMFDVGQIMGRVRRFPLGASSNGVKVPALDETSRVDGSRSGGVQGYWADEADTVTATKPKWRMMDLRLKKLMGLAYITDEMLQDSTFLGAYMQDAFTTELTFKVEDGIVNGDGAGKLLGILNSGALVTVSKEAGQAADTVVSANILKMFSRLPPRSMTNAVWLVNQDTLPQLWGLTLGTGASGALLYAPPGIANPNAGPAGSLLARPVIPIEQAATVGDVGDIILADLDTYMMLDKGGIQAQSSMHVRFVYDEMTYRFTYRVEGQPMARSAVTPFKGAATKSPYVVLEAR